MLYPIELLGHMTGRMLTASTVFVMHIKLLAKDLGQLATQTKELYRYEAIFTA